MTLRHLLSTVIGLDHVRRAAPLSTLSSPAEWLVEALGGGSKTFAGQVVSPKSSLELVPVWSAVSLLSGAIATVPLIVYRDRSNGDRRRRERARDTLQWKYLHQKPNEEMAADELWELVASHLLLWGNAFLAKIRNGFGQVAELWPISPDRVQVARIEGRKVFVVDGDPFTEVDILHVRGLGKSGLVGYSPIQQARQMLGASMARQEFEGTFWANGAFVQGFLTHPNELSEKAAARLARVFRGRWGGVRNAGRTPVLEEGMKYESATMPLRDAQFVEQAKLGDHRIAQLFGLVPPHRFGAVDDRTITYQNSELGATEFLRWTFNRWLVRIEGSLERDPDLFPPSLNLFPEFLREAILQGTTRERYEAYKLGLDAGFLVPDEPREAENLEPLPDGLGQKPVRSAPIGETSSSAE
jgi:HK97 family phage portal protein